MRGLFLGVTLCVMAIAASTSVQAEKTTGQRVDQAKAKNAIAPGSGSTGNATVATSLDEDAAVVKRETGFWSRIGTGSSHSVSVHLKKSDLTIRSKLQNQFIQTLIWRYYGKRSKRSKQLIEKIDTHYRGMVRQKFVEQVRKKFPEVLPFGPYVDNVVAALAGRLSAHKTDDLQIYRVRIPKYFFDRDKLNLEIEVVKDRVPFMRILRVDNNGQRRLVFRTLAAPGNAYRSFGTPNGILYTSRVIGAPRWYPCNVTWADGQKCRQPRGMNTAFGLWGMDLTRRNYLVGYGAKGSAGTVSHYLIHSTNRYGSPGYYASHGCVRIFPHKADELFAAIKHYYGVRNSTKTLDFGDITPFSRTIPVMIGTPVQLTFYLKELRKRQAKEREIKLANSKDSSEKR